MANAFALTWTDKPIFTVPTLGVQQSRRGDDVVWAFSKDIDTMDVRAWTLEFNVAASPNQGAIFTIDSANILKTIIGGMQFTTLQARTSSLGLRTYYYELLRTDEGFRKLLRFGFWELRA